MYSRIRPLARRILRRHSPHRKEKNRSKKVERKAEAKENGREEKRSTKQERLTRFFLAVQRKDRSLRICWLVVPIRQSEALPMDLLLHLVSNTLFFSSSSSPVPHHLSSASSSLRFSSSSSASFLLLNHLCIRIYSESCKRHWYIASLLFWKSEEQRVDVERCSDSSEQLSVGSGSGTYCSESASSTSLK